MPYRRRRRCWPRNGGCRCHSLAAEAEKRDTVNGEDIVDEVLAVAEAGFAAQLEVFGL